MRVTEIPADASGDVELWAKWKEQKPAPVFTDVDYSDSSWYGDAVTYVASKGLITGYSDGTTLFGVGDVLTRSQLATILWRNACPDEAASYDPGPPWTPRASRAPADGQYYTAAANWAVKNGVISGYVREDGSKDFAANDDVSFEQLVTILPACARPDDELAAAGSDLPAFADGDLARPAGPAPPSLGLQARASSRATTSRRASTSGPARTSPASAWPWCSCAPSRWGF